MMMSNKPYLLRAFYQWIVDCRCTPIVVINVHHPRCRIPQEFVEGDEIVFNVNPSAVRDMKMTNDAIEFRASFSGVVHTIFAPVKAIAAIYAEENGEGLFFDKEDLESDDDEQDFREPVKLTSIDGLGPVVTDSSGAEMLTPKSNVGGKPFLKLVE